MVSRTDPAVDAEATKSGRMQAVRQPIRVLLVDDQELVRAGFTMALDAQPDISVVGEARDGAHVLELLRATPADVRADAPDGRDRGDPPHRHRASQAGRRSSS
jgi:hypothetical protein